MRNAFADEVNELAALDPRIVMLSADIGNRLFDKFKVRNPGRFFNTGVAEANTISMAAGLASSGLRPICYTITPFITARCYEQIKVDVCYHGMPVVIVGTGSGLSYAALGATHHSLDDIALMRVLPEMRVLAPADAMELRSCLRSALCADHPTYIRIGKKGEPIIFPEPPNFEFGSWTRMREGTRVALLAAGNTLPMALEASVQLEKDGISGSVFSCASIKPLDVATLTSLFSKCDAVVTIEEHALKGGFGSAVAEWVADTLVPQRARLLRFGAGDYYLHDSGEQDHARRTYGLTAEEISSRVLGALHIHSS
jgi:transketolase